MKLTDEIVSLWGELFPVDGYIAGLEEAQGRLFFNTPDNRKAAFDRIEALEGRLGEIEDENIQATAGKILRCFRAALTYVYPHSQVEACAWGLFAIMLKEDLQAPFVPQYVRNVEQMLALEIEKWRGREVPIELRKLSVDNADFLLATLDILHEQNEAVAELCHAAKKKLDVYRSLFYMDDIESRNFETTLALLRKESTGPRVTDGYDEILRELYDFPETAEELRGKALDWLGEEMPLLKASADRLAETYGMLDSTVEEVYAEMIRRHPVSQDVMGQAHRLMEVVNPYTAEHILGIGSEDQIAIRPTPEYLEPLGTSAMCMPMNELSETIKIICYITPSRNESWLTMLSALVHEFGHGFHASLTFRTVEEILLRLNTHTHLVSPLTEAIAFHRESELLEEVTSLLEREDLAPEEKGMLQLFGQSEEEQRLAIMGLEFETLAARIYRFLRILCDVEVNTGLRSYPDFLDWAHDRTELSRELIYEQTFTFLGEPGYAPCYAIAGNRLAELQRSALAGGVSRKEFNTRVSGMGYWPRTIYEKMLSP